MSTYLDTTHDVYKEAALTPDVGLCCTTNPIWELPGLKIPKIMQEMNYGCGSTVHARDLTNNPKMLYVGVGGGMELLQFAYFNRQKNGVIGIDVVDEMLEASRKNFIEAEAQNDWFKSEFVDLKKGDAMNLPVEDNSIDVAAQNCLFNIFKSIEVAAIKDPMPEDGPCIFTGKAAIYYGSEDYFDDKKGHVLVKNQPLAICDKTAGAIAALGRDDIYISESTYHYDGGGCC